MGEDISYTANAFTIVCNYSLYYYTPASLKAIQPVI